MFHTRFGRRLTAACALLAAAWLTSAATQAADDDKALRKEVLALNDVTGDEPIKAEVKALLADPARAKKLLAAGVTMVKEKKQPFNYTGAAILAEVALKQKNLDAATAFLKVCVAEANTLKSASKLNQAYTGLIAVYFDGGKYDDVVKLCQEILEMRGDEATSGLMYFAWETMVQTLARQGKIDLANKELDPRLEKQPDNWLLLELRGLVQRESGKYDDSAATYEKALQSILKDKELDKEEQEKFAKRVRYLLSGVYVDANKVDKAAEHLKALLKQEPDSPTYNNDLGYIWADHGTNLDEAEKIIRKAIEDDRKQRKAANPDATKDELKDNAAYLDSLGWVLFKKKQYKEAKPYLEEAVKDEEGRHVEIYDHLAEVNLALGDKAGAVAAWKKGVEVAGKTKREQQRKADVEKKLKANQ